MPGVLIIEAMAQVGGMLLMGAVPDPEKKVVYFTSLNNVKWRRPVKPGDQLRFELELLQVRGMMCKMQGSPRSTARWWPRRRWAPWCATNDDAHPSDGARARRGELGADVEIGPFAIVGENCRIGDGCVIAARATLERNVILGTGVKVGIGTVLGGDPQDLKFKGELTTVEIGDGTTIREYTTINRGTTQSYKTTVGKGCFIMSYVHLAHDCHVGDGVILVNSVQLAGHVTVGDKAIIAGQSAAHQFVKIGQYSFVGGCSRISQDVPAVHQGGRQSDQALRIEQRRAAAQQLPEEVVRELKRAYRLFFRSELNVSQAKERAATELKPFPEVQELLRSSRRAGAGWSSERAAPHRRDRRGEASATTTSASSATCMARRSPAFFDARVERAEQVSRELGVTAHPSLDALLDVVDAVTIVVPTPAHFAVARECSGEGSTR
jgi:UDP-N-acetylglucosamine acyltransferase